MKNMSHKHNSARRLQSGAVSIFAVIFSMLLITVVTVSFVRIMIREQQQASAADLSQSAYDSALAGVEDAKRLIVFCQSAGSAAQPECIDLASKTCTESLSAVRMATGANAAENPVQAGSSANDFEQAYTCLKINPTPIDYIGRLDKDQPNVIALASAEGQAQPSEITIEWMTKQDFSGDELKVPSLANYTTAATSHGGLPSVVRWGEAKWPAAVQVQRITNTATDPTSGTIDGGPSIAWNNKMSLPNDNSQLLLLPTRTTQASVVTQKAFPVERITPYTTGTPVEGYGFAGCLPSAAAAPSEYYCSMNIPFSSSSSVSLFKITPLYRGAHYRITMKDAAGNQLSFKGVQAVVDATGRASDVFRRVEARIDMASVAPYPDAAVETSSSLCKTMFVTNDSADFSSPSCS